MSLLLSIYVHEGQLVLHIQLVPCQIFAVSRAYHSIAISSNLCFFEIIWDSKWRVVKRFEGVYSKGSSPSFYQIQRMVAMIRAESKKMGDDGKEKAAGMELMKPIHIGLHQLTHR